MYKIEEETLKNSLKPFDLVKLTNGDIAYIKEVSVNDGQITENSQISYSIRLLYGTETKTAWYNRSELEFICNLFVKFAEDMVHPFGTNREWVGKLVNAGRY